MEIKPSRTALLLAGLAAAGAAALAVNAFVIEPAQVEVTREDLPIADLPEAWEGATVVHLTDLHYGDPRSEQLFGWLVETVNGLNPDLILITGDFVLRRQSEGKAAVRHLRQLHARHGVVGVLGDHDFCGVCKDPIHNLEGYLEGAGIRLLRNTGIVLEGGLCIAGLDPTTRKIHRGRLEQALEALPAPPHILLAHSPEVILDASDAEVPLVLCGHTHGGQVVVPFYGPPVTHTRVPKEYCSGWSRLGNTRMFTGRGLASHYSLRFLCRPQIVVFTLRRAEELPQPAEDTPSPTSVS